MIFDQTPSTAAIIAFPKIAQHHVAPCRAVGSAGHPPAPVSATSLARRFTGHFLPVVQASVDLLEADNAAFEARCRNMLDADGTAMIDELCAECETVGRQMRLLADSLDLTRARLRTAMSRLAVDPPVAI